MITTRLCPQCHQPLAPDAPSGLCPQCLMKAASGPPPSAAGDGIAGDIIDIANPEEVAKKLPQFEIIELLGRGGMGVVYKARQIDLDRVVALKILPPLDAQSPDFIARFTREARALAKLNHPNIVNVYPFGAPLHSGSPAMFQFQPKHYISRTTHQPLRATGEVAITISGASSSVCPG
jgi:serine/threonine protein kinase